jgi:hypothetical protein
MQALVHLTPVLYLGDEQRSRLRLKRRVDVDAWHI